MKTVRALVGRVVSDKMKNTVTVVVERRVVHPVIGKVVRRSKKYHAHCDNNEYVVGDVVNIEECRPISKSKAWKVTSVVARGGEI